MITLWRCACCKGSPDQSLLKELQPLDLASFFFLNMLSLQLLLSLFMGILMKLGTKKGHIV
jgi:hypothetical protein